jgi:hypothetical protein
MDKVRKPNIFVCYTPSSEPYSIYFPPSVLQHFGAEHYRSLEIALTNVG